MRYGLARFYSMSMSTAGWMEPEFALKIFLSCSLGGGGTCSQFPGKGVMQ